MRADPAAKAGVLVDGGGVGVSVTVREWFRVQRGVLWQSNEQLAIACEDVSTRILKQRLTFGWHYIGNFDIAVLTLELPLQDRAEFWGWLEQRADWDRRRYSYTKDLA